MKLEKLSELPNEDLLWEYSQLQEYYRSKYFWPKDTFKDKKGVTKLLAKIDKVRELILERMHKEK